MNMAEQTVLNETAEPVAHVAALRPGRDPDFILGLALLALLCAAPTVLEAIGRPYWTDIAQRAVILAIAAASLNFIIGLGGLISLGHGAFFGIGAYSVGILASYEIDNGWIQLGATLLLSALFAFVTGIISLRTRGVHFIMITLAFGQMLYFTMVGLRQFGGDDGLTIDYSSMLPPVLDLSDRPTLFYASVGVLALVMYAFARVRRSAFGLLLLMAKGNERRAQSQGFHITAYRLVAYVISGMVCGVAGFLDANFSSFVTPEGMSWTASAELIFMVIVGGVGTIAGPVVGALVFLIIEEALGGLTVYWHFWFGLFLIAVVLYARGGLVPLLVGRKRR
jgi:branched-chain amino acid transport system permease protein